MKAIWNKQVIAESNDTVIVESNHYFPASSINSKYFEKSGKTSQCFWKGTAHYYSVTVDGETNRDAAWYYPSPKPKAENIKDRIAFWRGIEITE